MAQVVHRDLAFNLAAQGDFAGARTYIEHALRVAQELGLNAYIATAMAIRGWISFLQGEWPAAREDLEGAVALDERGDSTWNTAFPRILLARLSLAEGDGSAAAAAANVALEVSRPSGDMQSLRWASRVLAEHDLMQGRPAAAADRLLQLLDRDGLVESDVTDLLPVLARAHLALGQSEQAVAVATSAIARARAEAAKPLLTEALWVQALVALYRRDGVLAERALRDGLELASSLSYPYAEARLLYVQGLLWAESGDTERARVSLWTALNLSTVLGRGTTRHRWSLRSPCRAYSPGRPRHAERSTGDVQPLMDPKIVEGSARA